MNEVEKLKENAAAVSARINAITEQLYTDLAAELGCSREQAIRHVFDYAIKRVDDPAAVREILLNVLARRRT